MTVPAPGGTPAPVRPLPVSPPTYLTSCLICGRPLRPVLLSGAHAPWVCPVCCHAWWVCELGSAARAGWERGRRAFHWKVRAGMESALTAEREEAARRGTSVLPEHLPLLSVTQLKMVGKAATAGTRFAAAVEAQIAERGKQEVA